MTDLERLEGLYLDRVLPAYRDLLAAVRADFRTLVGGVPAFDRVGSRFHGLGHWVRVGAMGLYIADALPPDAFPFADRARPVLLAAFFHDCGRTIDGYEPGHAEAGATIFGSFARRWDLPTALARTVATAIRLHEAPESVVPGADGIAIALANADRLDRVRLGDRPIPERMYPDGTWERLAPVATDLLGRLTNRRAWADVADIVEWARDP